MSRKLTQKQEVFCLKYFELGNASVAARLAKYSPKTAGVIGRENLLKPKIQARINELRREVERASIASVIERKQILTDIAKERRLRPATPKETTLAIAELNKMEGNYAPDKHAVLGDIVIEVVYRDQRIETEGKTEPNLLTEGSENVENSHQEA